MSVPTLTRRCYVTQWTPAEKAIKAAVKAVEEAGCDSLLTDAVIFLDRAFERVADYVDASTIQEYPSSPPYHEEGRAPGFKSVWLNTFCPICDCRQFTSPGGSTCAQGHGGAEGIYHQEKP